MAINLLNLEPNKVTTDLSGYITYVYGGPKVGKTTLASQMDKALLLAFEAGYHAIPGIVALDVKTWGEMKQIIRELKKPEVKEVYKCIVIDTVDIASSLCEKYICSQLDIDNIGDGGWATNSWSKVKKEFEETFRTIAQMGYALFFISHDKEKEITLENGQKYMQKCPTLGNAYQTIISSMADIYGYAHPVMQPDGTSKVMLTLRSLDNSVSAGCRFKYIAPEVEFNYPALTKAISEAIDKEAEMTQKKFITDESFAKEENITDKPSFEATLESVNTTINGLINSHTIEDFKNNYSPKIVEITEKYLGKGKKINQCVPSQVELLQLIEMELKELS